MIERRAQQRDHLRPVRDFRRVFAAIVLDAETDTGHLKPAELSSAFHARSGGARNRSRLAGRFRELEAQLCGMIVGGGVYGAGGQPGPGGRDGVGDDGGYVWGRERGAAGAGILNHQFGPFGWLHPFWRTAFLRRGVGPILLLLEGSLFDQAAADIGVTPVSTSLFPEHIVSGVLSAIRLLRHEQRLVMGSREICFDPTIPPILAIDDQLWLAESEDAIKALRFVLDEKMAKVALDERLIETLLRLNNWQREAVLAMILALTNDWYRQGGG